MNYVSYSRVESLNKCPFSFKLRYIDGLKTYPTQNPQDARLIGSALHKGCETGNIADAINEYFNNYYIINDLQIDESIKFEILIPKVLELVETLTTDTSKCINEFEFEVEGFKGIVDLLCPNSDGSYDLYDFKYSNNVDSYLKSGQLHVYKHYLEKIGYKINRLGFIFIPKTMIRQKKNETIDTFRIRLKETLSSLVPKVEYVEFDRKKVVDFVKAKNRLPNITEFPKNETRLCDWCDYKMYCKEGLNYMFDFPKNERSNKSVDRKPDMWIYGGSYTGKTTFADKFDNNLIFNTDGNVDMVTSPVIRIKDVVEKQGRVVKRTFAWEVFKMMLEKLESETTDFEVITIDLVEDLYEHCRLYMYDKNGWEHEQDGGYGKGYDAVKTEFLSTMKRLKNIGYRVILISKLLTGEVTRGSNRITTYSPNIKPQFAEIIAGIVDMTVLVEADGDNRTMNFKASPYIFGGSRFNFKVDSIPLDPKELEKAIEESSSVPVNQDVTNRRRISQDN